MADGLLAVIGLGLIGGSVALSLKGRNAGWRVRAFDRRRKSLEYALRRGIVDEAAESEAGAIAGADLVLLATPVGAIRSLLRALAPHLSSGQTVTDVGSTKASIVAEAGAVLPGGVAFVGGHPIAGTERSGIEAAAEGLFEGRRCILTPTAETPRAAVEVVTAFWSGLGAEVKLLAPDVHDFLLARLSHLPNLVAYALVNAVSAAVSPESLDLAGGSLRDVTRVAQSPPALWRDVCLENREAVAGALGEFADQLQRLREAVEAGDGEALQAFLSGAREARATTWRA